MRESALPDLTGTTALITGGSGGVGRGIVQQFARAGAHVVIHYFNQAEPAEELAQTLISQGFSVSSLGADIRDLAACQELVAKVVAAHDELTTVVNNAGIQPLVPFAELDPSKWSDIFDTNVTGTFAMSHAAAAQMKQQPGGGSITHIASIEATRPAFNHAHYCASKAAVVMHAKAAALELGQYGIRVNTVSPGLIDRGDLAESWPQGRGSWLSTVPLQRTGTPEDIGDACVFLASPMARWITGQDLTVDGGMSITPGW